MNLFRTLPRHGFREFERAGADVGFCEAGVRLDGYVGKAICAGGIAGWVQEFLEASDVFRSDDAGAGGVLGGALEGFSFLVLVGTAPVEVRLRLGSSSSEVLLLAESSSGVSSESDGPVIFDALHLRLFADWGVLSDKSVASSPLSYS